MTETLQQRDKLAQQPPNPMQQIKVTEHQTLNGSKCMDLTPRCTKHVSVFGPLQNPQPEWVAQGMPHRTCHILPREGLFNQHEDLGPVFVDGQWRVQCHAKRVRTSKSPSMNSCDDAMFARCFADSSVLPPPILIPWVPPTGFEVGFQ